MHSVFFIVSMDYLAFFSPVYVAQEGACGPETKKPLSPNILQIFRC